MPNILPADFNNKHRKGRNLSHFDEISTLHGIKNNRVPNQLIFLKTEPLLF